MVRAAAPADRECDPEVCGQCAATCEEEVTDAWGAAGLPMEDPPLPPPPHALSCQNMKIRLKQAAPPLPPHPHTPTPTHARTHARTAPAPAPVSCLSQVYVLYY